MTSPLAKGGTLSGRATSLAAGLGARSQRSRASSTAVITMCAGTIVTNAKSA
jgi:hypothetical protein